MLELSPGASIALFVVAGVLLAKSASVLVRAIINLARYFRLPEFVVSFVIVAMATSLPELFIGVVSAMRGESEFALGAVIGSNIADMTLVAGILGIVAGAMGVRKILEKRDAYYTAMIAMTLFLFLLDGKLTRLEGGVLLVIYFLYLLHLSGQIPHYPKKMKKGKLKPALKSLGLFVVGMGGLLLGAEIMVRSAEVISAAFNLPFVLMGLLLVSFSTSIPELVFELQAIKKNHNAMAMGDLLGSVVTNTALVVGVVALISPIDLLGASVSVDVALGFLVLSTVMFLFMLRTQKVLTRYEGAALVAVYVLYLFVEYARLAIH